MKKKLLLAVVVVGLVSSVTLALDPMGPPAAGLKKGQCSIGVEYSYSDMDLTQFLTSWSSNTNKTLEINKLQKVYANLGYGISDNWEGFLRLGAATLDYDFDITYPDYRGTWEGDGDWDFAIGAGVKTTFAEQPGLKWGALAQYSWTEVEGDRTRKGPFWSSSTKGSFEVELSEWQIAFGPTWTPFQGLAVYGGPFLHFVDGRHTNTFQDDTNHHPIEEDELLGGYAGVQVEVGKNTCVNVEWMTTGEADALGARLVFRR